MRPIQRRPAPSKMIKTVGYDPETRELEIEFLRTGKIARYSKVPKHIYDDLLRAQSMGRYFTHNIRPVFDFVYMN